MEVVKFILYFFSNIFVSFSVFYGYSKLINKEFNIKRKKSLIFMITMGLLSTINNLYMIPTFKVFVVYLIILGFCKILYKESMRTTIFGALVITIISIFLEIILSTIFGLFVQNINSLNDNIVVKLLFSVTHTTTFILIMKYTKISKWVEKAKDIISNFLNFFTMSLIVILILNIIVYFRAEDFDQIGILVILLIAILMTIIFLRILIIDKYNNRILLEKNKHLKKTYETYAKINEEYRTLKHNLNGDLYTLETALPKKQQELIKQILKKYNKNSEMIEDLGYVPEGLQGLFFIKQKEAEAKKVNVNIRCSKEINTQFKDYLSLCNTINILLDNAIEASKNTTQKMVEVDIKENNDKLEINILNTFNNSLDINNIGKRNYSTKEIKSGIGLDYIKNLKNKNIKVTFKIVGDLFIVKVIYKEVK